MQFIDGKDLHTVCYSGKSCFTCHKNVLYLLYPVPLHFLEGSWEGEQKYIEEIKNPQDWNNLLCSINEPVIVSNLQLLFSEMYYFHGLREQKITKALMRKKKEQQLVP